MVTFLCFFHKKIESLSRLQCGRGSSSGRGRSGGRGAAAPRTPFKINAARSLTKKISDVFYVLTASIFLRVLDVF